MPIINTKGFENCICHRPSLVNIYDSTLGPNTKIAAFVEIGGATVGANCKIQAFAFIPPGTTIGDNCFIGPHVTFTNVTYPNPTLTAATMTGPIIENNVVIGANATILPGVTVGHNSFVGAGSVVTHDIPPHTTVCGNPAKPHMG